MKYSTKKIQRIATEIVNHMTPWMLLDEVIVFFISQFYVWRDQIV